MAGYLDARVSLPLAEREADLTPAPSPLRRGEDEGREEEVGLSLPIARDVREDGPVPPILLIGQAPGLRATRENVPFAGISGAKLRQWFALAGLTEADYWRLILFSAITKCYPGRLPGAKGDRVPTLAEQALCRPWLDAQFAILDPPIVVLVGQLAITTFLGKGPLQQFVGQGFLRSGRRWLPLPHPSGVSTWLNVPANQARVAAGMDILRGWLAELGIVVGGEHDQRANSAEDAQPAP